MCQTLLQFFETTYQPCRLSLSPWKTLDTYRGAIRAVDRHLGRPCSVDELSDQLLAAVCEKTTTAGNSRETAGSYLRHLLPLWRMAHEMGLTPTPPTMKQPKRLRKLPKAWTTANVGQLLAAARHVPGNVGPVKAAAFWRAYLLFLFDTGARKSVTLNLTPADFDLERQYSRLPAENQKQLAEQIAPFSAQTLEALQEIWDDARPLVFCWPYDRYPKTTWTAFNRALRKIVKAAGLDPRHGLSQRLRRTRATYGEAIEPGSATADLGHANRSTTQGHYIDTTLLPQTQRVVDRLERPQEPPPSLRLHG